MAPGEDYLRLRGSVHAVLQDLGKLLGDLVERPAATLGGGESAAEAQEEEDAAQSIIDTQLNAFFGAFRSLKLRHEDESLSLAVLALTKSGG